MARKRGGKSPLFLYIFISLFIHSVMVRRITKKTQFFETTNLRNINVCLNLRLKLMKKQVCIDKKINYFNLNVFQTY